MTEIDTWTSFLDPDATERHLRRAFGDLAFAPALLPAAGIRRIVDSGVVPGVPAADMYETSDEYVVELEVPGYEEKELGIEVSGHTLTVRGQRQETKDAKEKTFRRRERLENTFERRFELPAEADTRHVKAVFKNGVLELHVAKAKTAQPRKVAISKAAD